MEISIYFYAGLILAGLFGGILAGMFGMGGGVAYTFIIPFFLEFLDNPIQDPEVIIANSFVCIFFASLSSMVQVYRSEKIDYTQILIASVFAIFFAHLTQYFIVSQSWFSMKIFRFIVLILICFITFRLYFSPKEKIKREEKWFDMPIVGSVGGFIAALSGLGGGVVMVPIMLFLGIYGIKRAKNISSGVIVLSSLSIVVIAMNAPDTTTEIMAYGKILPNLCMFIVVGTLVGGPLGVKIAQKMSSDKLVNAYLVVLLLLMIYYLIKIVG